MKRLVTVILLALFLCTSCSKNEKLVRGETLTEESDSNRLKSDWSNYGDCLCSEYGLVFNLHKLVDENGTLGFVDEEVFDEENLKLKANFSFDAAVENPDDVVVTVMVLVNKKICDFTLGDSQSQNGVLTKDFPVGIHMEDDLTVENCELHCGENYIEIVMVQYFPQFGRSNGGCVYSSSFQSTIETKAKVEYCTGNRYEDVLTYYNEDMYKQNFSQMGNFLFDCISFENLIARLKKGAEVKFCQKNFFESEIEKDGIERRKNRELLVLMMNCGQVETLFNGLPYAIISMKEEDYAVEIPVPVHETGKSYAETICIVSLEEDDIERGIYIKAFCVE